MREQIKVKVLRDGNKIDVVFLDGKTEIGSVSKYIERCLVCGVATTSDDDFGGKKYICPHCTGIVRQVLRSDEKVSVASESFASETKIKNTTSPMFELYRIVVEYKPSVRVVNYKEYQNVMTQRCNEKMATLIVDQILKGNNTVSKIAKKIGTTKTTAIYTYMKTMARAGMLYKTDVGVRYNTIYKINPKVVYTSV